MASFNKQVKQVLADWRQNRIGLNLAAQRLVGLGWSAEQAYAFLARY